MMKKMTIALFLYMALMPLTADAGQLDSPGLPSAGSGMPTTSDIYNRLDTGAAINIQGTFQEPGAGPTAGTGKSLIDIQGKLPMPDNTNGATMADVLSGKTFWGLRTDGTWGLKTGSLSSRDNVTGGNGLLNFAIPDGYYSGRTATANDTNLATGNIKSGATIFGVGGAPNVVDTTEATAPAASVNISAGKKAWVNGASVTGTLYGGCTCSGTMNGTRWCDNGDGTVTDLLGGSAGVGKCLVWLKDAGWGGPYPWDTTMFDKVSTVANGTPASLTDGSAAGDWRMPTKAELTALATGTEAVLSGTPRAFSNVQGLNYWSGSSFDSNLAWFVHMYYGAVSNVYKFINGYVWPVRSGQ